MTEKIEFYKNDFIDFTDDDDVYKIELKKKTLRGAINRIENDNISELTAKTLMSIHNSGLMTGDGLKIAANELNQYKKDKNQNHLSKAINHIKKVINESVTVVSKTETKY